MLFNIVLVPMQIVILWMIVKIYWEPERFHFEMKPVKGFTEHLFEKEFIRKYNKGLIIPFLAVLYTILVLMSFSTMFFPREIYHNHIMLGFFLYFSVCILFYLLSRYHIGKELGRD